MEVLDSGLAMSIANFIQKYPLGIPKSNVLPKICDPVKLTHVIYYQKFVYHQLGTYICLLNMYLISK